MDYATEVIHYVLGLSNQTTATIVTHNDMRHPLPYDVWLLIVKEYAGNETNPCIMFRHLKSIRAVSRAHYAICQYIIQQIVRRHSTDMLLKLIRMTFIRPETIFDRVHNQIHDPEHRRRMLFLTQHCHLLHFYVKSCVDDK